MTDLTATQIQIALENLAKSLSAREYRLQAAHATLSAHEQACVYLAWNDTLDEKHGYKYLYADTMQQALTAAAELVSALPYAKERAQTVFAKVLSAAIETGKKTGIDMSYLNPLTDMMKKLSENALEFHPDPVTPVAVPTGSVNLYPDAPVVDFTALDKVGLAPQVIDEQTTDQEFERLFNPLR